MEGVLRLKSNLFKKKRRDSYLIAAAFLATGAALAVVCFFMPPFIWLCLVSLAYGVIQLVINQKIKKSMEAFHIDAAAIQAAETELQGAWARHFGKISVSGNWVMNLAVTGPALFPVRAITSIQKGFTRRRYGGSHYVQLKLTDGTEHKLGCKAAQRDELMALLACFCPWTNTQSLGTYQ